MIIGSVEALPAHRHDIVGRDQGRILDRPAMHQAIRLQVIDLNLVGAPGVIDDKQGIPTCRVYIKADAVGLEIRTGTGG